MSNDRLYFDRWNNERLQRLYQVDLRLFAAFDLLAGIGVAVCYYVIFR